MLPNKGVTFPTEDTGGQRNWFEAFSGNSEMKKSCAELSTEDTDEQRNGLEAFEGKLKMKKPREKPQTNTTKIL
ncbi:unnamed protein product [Haemonchus placei]|uniref:Uncharacterized protein n=1 Tax=Haemonchus placei TaxID=6290 RepID=A0A0N4W9T4_HAEPC|nr:unnamed protein product [Haemonchus placei]